MKYLLALVFLVFSGSQSIAAPSYLGACTDEFGLTLQDAKQEFLTSSPWNYDRDYDLEDVRAVTNTGNEDFVLIDMYLDVDGLDEFVSTYRFDLHYTDETKVECEWVEYNLEN